MHRIPPFRALGPRAHECRCADLEVGVAHHEIGHVSGLLRRVDDRAASPAPAGSA